MSNFSYKKDQIKSGDTNPRWWAEEYEFFGDFYAEGDNSKEGYLSAKKMNLAERTRADVDGVVKLLELKNHEKILDIPCGYGRHSIELAKRGFRVVGSDINSVFLNAAKKESLKNNLEVDFVKEDMAEISYKEEFDALINMCYSFGFFETDEENMEVLKKFYQALKDGGKFLMHTDVNLARIRSGKYKTDETRNLFSGNKLQIIDRYNPATKRIDGAWIIIKPNGTKIRKNYSVRVFEKDEFIDWCLRAGFKKCTAFGDWNGNPYSEDCEEINFVAEK